MTHAQTGRDPTPEPRPGFILTHRGSDIGVVERIENFGRDGIPTLHVVGGVSGSLHYAIPATAVADVEPSARRFSVREDMRFEPVLAQDGEVRFALSAASRALVDQSRGGRRLPRACAGYRVYARDGFLGEVEAALCQAGGEVDYLVVRARRLLRTRYPVVPATYVVWCDAATSVIRVAGARRELLRLSERMPLAS